MKKKMISFFLAVMVGCSALPATGYAATQVYVKSTVNVRSQASNSSQILGVVARGSKIEKLSEARGWTKVRYKGEEAYIASSFLTEIRSEVTTESPTSQGTTTGPVVSTAAPSSSTSSSVSTPETAKRAKVYVNHSSVNVREKASNKSTLLGTAKRGTSFYRVESKNGWTKVEYGAGYAYIASQYLTATQPSASTASKKVYVNYKRVNVRKSASSKSTLLGYATRGQAFKSYGVQGAYTKVGFNKGYGFIATKYLTTTAPQTTTSKPTTTKGSAVYVSNRYVNVRAAASSKSALLGKVYKGEKLLKLGTSGAFTKIQYGNSVGYVATVYLSNKAVSTTQQSGASAYVSNRYVNVRAKASSKSALLGKLYKGAKVTVVGTEGSFKKIKYNNGYAYVASQYLSA